MTKQHNTTTTGVSHTRTQQTTSTHSITGMPREPKRPTVPLLVTHNRNGLIRYVTPQPQPANHLQTTQGKERTTTTTATETQQKGGDIGTHTPQCTIMDNTKEGQRDIKPVCVWGQTGNNTNTQREGDNTTGEKQITHHQETQPIP